jgi:hypothetical protein
MRNSTFVLFAIVLAVFSSCIGSEDPQLEFYAEKEVTLNTKRILAQSETALARLQSNLEFPDYTHHLPSHFNVYFIATTGSDQGKVIKEFDSMAEGSHKIVVPSRAYKVVITNYDMDHLQDKRRNFLPEYSSELFFYGEATIDYKTLTEGEVTVTNDYAASMIKKSDMIKSTPKINDASYFDTIDYYILYLRDQGGASTFTRNTTFNILKMDGGNQQYNHQYLYTANKVSRFLFNLYSETDGNLDIILDENILKETEDRVIVPNI